MNSYLKKINGGGKRKNQLNVRDWLLSERLNRLQFRNQSVHSRSFLNLVVHFTKEALTAQVINTT